MAFAKSSIWFGRSSSPAHDLQKIGREPGRFLRKVADECHVRTCIVCHDLLLNHHGCRTSRAQHCHLVHSPHVLTRSNFVHPQQQYRVSELARSVGGFSAEIGLANRQVGPAEPTPVLTSWDTPSFELNCPSCLPLRCFIDWFLTV